MAVPAIEIAADTAKDVWYVFHADGSQFLCPLRPKAGWHEEGHSPTGQDYCVGDSCRYPSLSHADLVGKDDTMTRQASRERPKTSDLALVKLTLRELGFCFLDQTSDLFSDIVPVHDLAPT
ncbi:MAG TPA: hypothetical protein VHX61_18240 [Rhizomicrobium sp.]|nr:hypothetical protein [Rhizomicrobium sp.]